MLETSEASEQGLSHRRGGGRLGRRALRGAPMVMLPTLVRKIPVYQMVPDEAVELIHQELLAILEEVGCEFRDDEAIAIWKEAGADVSGTRVRIDRAFLMELVSKTPSEFTINARNPERSVRVGGKNTIFVPMYGAPYVRDLDNKRRYGIAGRPQQFPQAGLHGAGAAFVQLDHLRADGRAGAQTASAHHPFGAKAFRQAVHGRRSPPGSAPRTR